MKHLPEVSDWIQWATSLHWQTKQICQRNLEYSGKMSTFVVLSRSCCQCFACQNLQLWCACWWRSFACWWHCPAWEKGWLTAIVVWQGAMESIGGISGLPMWSGKSSYECSIDDSNSSKDVDEEIVMLMRTALHMCMTLLSLFQPIELSCKTQISVNPTFPMNDWSRLGANPTQCEVPSKCLMGRKLDMLPKRSTFHFQSLKYFLYILALSQPQLPCLEIPMNVHPQDLLG